VSSTFRIDSDIGGTAAVRQRDLQPWVPGEDADADLSLEGAAKAKSPSRGAEWDQFEANERLYGVKSDYDENLYTTAIDRTNPLYKQRLAAAERIAREIEGASAMNSHVAEERGLILGDDSGMDEEDK
jgi:PAB1-binding protein PBP1